MLSPWIVETIKEAARQELKDKDERLLSQLSDWVDQALLKWKLEKGDRNPQKNGFGLLSTPTPIPFEEAQPWECAGLFFPCRLSLGLKLIGEGYPDFMAILEKTNFQLLLALLIEQESTSGDDLFIAYDALVKHRENWNGQIAATLQNWHKIQAADTQKKILDSGRVEGVKVRQAKAKENWDTLDKAINDLFSDSSKPGWQWTNKEIADFISRNHTVYAPSTVEQRVKKLAAAQRRNRVRPENY